MITDYDLTKIKENCIIFNMQFPGSYASLLTIMFVCYGLSIKSCLTSF